jgi:uncharacterized protein (DUF433 family)
VTIPILAEAPPIRDIGGVLRVGQTGVLLETLLWAFQRGSTPEDIVDQFPSLALADVYDVIAYYLRHRGELEPYLTAREAHYRDETNEILAATPEGVLQRRLRSRRRQ